MNQELFSIITALLILALFVVCIVVRFKKYPSSLDKNQANKFLEGLSIRIYDTMCNIIASNSPTEYDSVEEFEADILKKIYTQVYDYIKNELARADQNDIFTIMTLRVLDEKFIYKYIDSLIEKFEINDRLKSVEESVKIDQISESSKKEDNELAKEFSNSELYNEEVSDEDLAPAEEVCPTEEELAGLNPQTDDEVEYDPESDSSVEVVEDDTFIDAAGRKRSKATGRYVK